MQSTVDHPVFILRQALNPNYCLIQAVSDPKLSPLLYQKSMNFLLCEL